MGKKQYDLSSMEGLEKVFNDSVKEMAEEILTQTEIIYERAIEKFYNHYNPLYYNRTYSTYYASSGYDTLYSPENLYSNGNEWTSSIIIDTANIYKASGHDPRLKGKENGWAGPYRAGIDWVFERTYKQGVHGIWAGKRFDKDVTKRYTKLRVRGGKKTITADGKILYDAISSFSATTRTMQNMVPSPSAIMNTEFKKLTRKKNLKAMFNQIFTNKIR